MNILSIIIPAFNTDKYLSACLDSIVSQIYNDIEVIIVNDGSTDNSGDIANKYAQQYDFIKVIHQSNQGVSAARNRAIHELTGDYLVFLDSDDVLYEGFFQKVLELIKIQPDIIEVNADLIGEAGKVLCEKIFILGNSEISFNKTDVAKLRLSKQSKYYLWSRIIKKKLVKNIEFNEEISFCEDALYLTECYFRAEKIITINESLYGYRQHDSNVTVAKTIHNINQLTDLYIIVRNKITNSNDKQYKVFYLAFLINIIHLRKSMYTLEFKKIVCDKVTVEQISWVKEHYKWLFLKLRSEVAYLRRFSVAAPHTSNLLILLKSYIKVD